MIELSSRPLRSVLCIGAHCDDIEIGCGGTLLKLIASNRALRVTWVVFSSDAIRADEARLSARAFLADVTDMEILIEDFRGRYFPYAGAEIKEYFDALGRTHDPDLVFTHWRDDLHQDHRLLAELAYNTFRDHLVLQYEIPKWDGDLGRPNVYVHLDAGHCDTKVDLILRSFPSQADKHWFTGETFRSLLRLRGVESKAPSGYAEAFHCTKLLLGGTG
jgi:LmbE family N-acetylglucosaminyl deacetylase